MEPEIDSALGRRHLIPAVALFALLSLTYLATTTSRFRLDDEHILAARAQSEALWGEADQPQLLGNSRVRHLLTQGDTATQIEPLLPWIGAMAYSLAVRFGLGGAQALFLINPWMTALTAVVVFVTVAVLGGSPRTCLWCGLLFGLGTIAWPYATTFLRDTPAMAFVSLAYLGMALGIRNQGRDRTYAAILIVGGLVAGALAKNTVVAVAASLGLTALILSVWRLRAARSVGIVAAAALGALLIFVFIPDHGPLARYSLRYYGFLAAHFAESLRLPIVANALGPFLSPAKSVFLFSPPLLLSLVGSVGGSASSRRFAFYAWAGSGGLALAQGLFYREQWAGAVGWGLRYMLPALPALAVAAAPAVERMLAARRRTPAAMLLALLIASIVIQIAGSVVDWSRLYSQWTARGLGPFSPSASWDVRFLALPGQIALLGDRSAWSLLWARLGSADGVNTAIVPLVGLILALGAGLVARRSIRHRSWGGGWAGAALVASLVLPVFPTLGLAREDPAFGGERREFQQALGFLAGEARSTDLVIIDSYGTPLWAFWMNHWASDARWISLPFEIADPSGDSDPSSPSAETIALLEQAQAGQGRIWYATSNDAPDASLRRAIGWLDDHDRLLAEWGFAGEGRVSLRLYCGCIP